MRNNGKNAMKSVRIEKSDLLGTISTNKEKHMSDYLEAVSDYKELVEKICAENLEWAHSGNLKNFKNIKNVPRAPQSYEDEYTRASKMLQMSVDTVIELEADVFNQLVLDEWSWKTSFDLNNATYKDFL